MYVCSMSYMNIYTLSPDSQQSAKLVEIVPRKMIIPTSKLQFQGKIGKGQWENNEVANEYMND